MKMKNMICSHCGSEDVRRNADVAWSVEQQEWSVACIFDSATCENCGGETNIKEVDISNDKWKDNSIQFPRLIAEIAANIEMKEQHWNDLKESMDISEDELNELFDRANDEWERIKQNI